MLLSHLNQLLSFDHARCVYGDKKEFMTKKMEAFHLLSPFPLEWEQRYHEKQYLVHDPVALAAFHNNSLLHWSEARTIYHPEKSQTIADEASTFGLADGWVFTYQGRKSTELAVISLAGPTIEKSNRSRTILHNVLPHVGQAVIRIHFSKRPDCPKLTPRELEILTWTSRGKTAWEISLILNISRRTVEFHISNTFKKLDAVNSPQAVAVAMDYGLLEF